MKTAHFSIRGMHCDGCAQTIQHTLERQEGVQTCSVSFDEGAARVLYDPARVNSEHLVGVIEKAGFKAVESET